MKMYRRLSNLRLVSQSSRRLDNLRYTGRDFSYSTGCAFNQKIVLPTAYSTLAAEVIKDCLFAAIGTDQISQMLPAGRNVGKISSIAG